MTITSRASRRYEIRGALGEGGMGEVFEAFDRLTGRVVALKRVRTGAESLAIHSSTSGLDLRLALAQEFGALASLRHPNIIGVLDFGLDEDHMPFFTMEYLEDAAPFFEAGFNQPLPVQVNLITQMLNALVYIHRRNIIHRDLKPTNVLVERGQVRVLDFGLAAIVGEGPKARGTLGTLAYMSPETLTLSTSTKASDLYAIGVICYEMLAGKHPFDTSSITNLALQITTEAPDLSIDRLDSRFAPILGRLLAKDPADRYPSADALLAELRTVVGEMMPPETEAIRESFLQAAEFIGRGKELDQLKDALIRMIGGLGSAWLVGGESGVGKSRLLDELRTRALISGAVVLRGQAVSEGSSPFQVWRDVLRWLVFSTDLSDLEAAILHPIVPDISDMLERPIPEVPEIEPQAAQTRLFSTVEEILQRQPQPTVIVLEDLQWAGTESLALLAWLTRADLAILFIGNYRDDEKADLPTLLPRMVPIKLNRLSQDEIARLGRAMLGESAHLSEVVALLQRETEGNPFFLVEVARALVEGAGGLARVGKIEMPEKILAGGIKAVIHRRLNFVLDEDRPLLELAAVAGRQVDPAVIAVASGQADLAGWLSRCANAALLEMIDGRWRFTHDKLREMLLADLSVESSQRYHRQVAEALESVIETTHVALVQYAVTLAYHWHEAKVPDRELKYTILAAEQALHTDANHEALQFYRRALTLDTQLSADRPEDRLRRAGWYRAMGGAYYALGRMKESQEQYRAALSLLGYAEPDSLTRQTVHLMGQLLRQGRHRLAGLGTGKKANPITAEAARAFRELAETYFYNNDTRPAITASFSALNLSEQAEPSAELAQSYADTCIMAGFLGVYKLAESYSRLALSTAERLDEISLMHTILRLSLYRLSIGQWDTARSMLERTRDTYTRYGDRFGRTRSLGPLATVLRYEGRIDESLVMNAEYLRDARQRDDVFLQAWALSSQAANYLRLGETLEAAKLLTEAGIILSRNPNQAAEIRVSGLMSTVRLRQGEVREAQRQAQYALSIISRASFALYAVVEGYISTADTFLELCDLAATPAERTSLMPSAQQACAALQKIAKRFPICKPATLLSQGKLSWLDGRRDEAIRRWQQAEHEAAERSMPYEQALAQYELGRRQKNADLLNSAGQLFGALKAAYDVQNVENALDS